jgi:hypothetical protein
MDRTNEFAYVTDEFSGVQQAVDELKLAKQFCPWTLGGYVDERKNFSRLPGKLAHASTTTGGLVITIQQLSFTSIDAVVIHQSSNWLVERDISDLLVHVDPDPVNPLEPVIWE